MNKLHFNKNKLTGAQFIREYWQKKPGIFKNAFPDFMDILDEHELAGLAMEEDMDSRIIAENHGQWQHNAGPFEDFEPACKGNWTLLVQGLENVMPEAQALLDEFSFIPSWRIDDLMVSFSVPGAGVGPHQDQYDVFIIQGKGSRRWQIGLPGDYQETTPHPCIRQINDFEPVIDEVLQPGDMLYIPPAHPHNGVALQECINYSVGFRAPTQTELLSHFCDYLIDNDAGNIRYQDPDLIHRSDRSEIKRVEVEKFRQQMLNAVESKEFEEWLGKRLSETDKFIGTPYEESREAVSNGPYSHDEIMQLLNNGETFYKSPGLRYLHYERVKDSEQLQVFINGDTYQFSIEDEKEVILLLNSASWKNESKKTYKNCSHFVHNLSTLLSEGCWTV